MSPALANIVLGMMVIYLAIRITGGVIDLLERRRAYVALVKAITMTDKVARLHDAHLAKSLEDLKN